MVQLIQALEEVQEFHQLENNLQVTNMNELNFVKFVGF